MSVRISVRVVSKRKERSAVIALPGESIVDLDRSHPVLGNRYILKNHNDDQERRRVIAAYVRDLDADIQSDGPMAKEIRLLAERALAGERLALRCWCAPRGCHVDQVRARIFQVVGQDPNEFFLQ